MCKFCFYLLLNNLLLYDFHIINGLLEESFLFHYLNTKKKTIKDNNEKQINKCVK